MLQLRKQPFGHLAEFLGMEQADAGVVDFGDQPGVDQAAERAGKSLAGEVQMAGHVPFQARQLDRCRRPPSIAANSSRNRASRPAASRSVMSSISVTKRRTQTVRPVIMPRHNS